MFIIDCLPFRKGLNKESLSYFGSKFLEPGSLIKINIRGKNIPAIVLQSREVSEAKAEIKSAGFQLKKISAVSAKPFLQDEFLDAVKTSAEYFAATQGNILSHLIPSLVLENPNILPTAKEKNQREETKNTKSEVAILQAPNEERISIYRSLIREEFAKGKSVFLCLPQNESVKQAKENLERGIESFVCAFHREMSGKSLKKEWKKASQTEHPVLVIATAKWLFMPRDDFGSIILENENDNGWKTLSRPFMDLRFFAETLAKKKKIRIIFGDSFLRTETLYRYKCGEIAEFESVKWRLPQEINTAVVDFKKPVQKEFRILSNELLGLIRENVEKSSHLFIFAAKKGLSPITVCRDCGEQVRCSNCSSPMILHKKNPYRKTARDEGNVFKCHQCGETREAAEFCQKCKSWKLAAFGLGIDRVAEEIRKSFPNIKLFEIHKDIATTNAKASEIIKSFYENRGAVLLGTEIAFPYLYKKITSTAISSIDSLFSIPDFRIREKVFRLILQTKNLAKENFLIQSRDPEDQTIKLAVNGNLLEFYKKEMEDRQVLDYPPFGIFIKVTARGNKNFVIKETEDLKNILKEYDPVIFSSVHEKKGEQSANNAVIKMRRESWPENKLIRLLRSLPPHFEIKVDPDNLL